MAELSRTRSNSREKQAIQKAVALKPMKKWGHPLNKLFVCKIQEIEQELYKNTNKRLLEVRQKIDQK